MEIECLHLRGSFSFEWFVDDTFRLVVNEAHKGAGQGQRDLAQGPLRTSLMGSNRRFGLILAAACIIFYALGLRYGSGHLAWLVAAAVFLLIAVLMPRILQPLKNLWMKLGGLLHKAVSPVLLSLFYYLGVVPIGLIMQMLRMDPLRLKPNKKTYWVERKPPGPEPETMAELF
jgi:Saxitoxin biosynthesis operon protein SxtJ